MARRAACAACERPSAASARRSIAEWPSSRSGRRRTNNNLPHAKNSERCQRNAPNERTKRRLGMRDCAQRGLWPQTLRLTRITPRVCHVLACKSAYHSFVRNAPAWSEPPQNLARPSPPAPTAPWVLVVPPRRLGHLGAVRVAAGPRARGCWRQGITTKSRYLHLALCLRSGQDRHKQIKGQ